MKHWLHLLFQMKEQKMKAEKRGPRKEGKQTRSGERNPNVIPLNFDSCQDKKNVLNPPSWKIQGTKPRLPLLLFYPSDPEGGPLKADESPKIGRKFLF